MWTVKAKDFVSADQKAAEQRAVLLASYKKAFDDHLDAVAQLRQYDNRLTIVTYLGSTNPQWNAEAQAYTAWRDAALAHMFEQQAAVAAGEVEAPSVEQFIAGIPAIEWPAF